MTTSPRCVLCGRPKDEAPPSFSSYLDGVKAAWCPECGKSQGVDAAALVEENAALVEENAALREGNERLTDEIKRLRGALYTVMGACDAECAACGAYYVAKKALDDTKETT